VLADFTDDLPAHQRTTKNNCEPSFVHVFYLSPWQYSTVSPSIRPTYFLALKAHALLRLGNFS
jgi:hypothetical protein